MKRTSTPSAAVRSAASPIDNVRAEVRAYVAPPLRVLATHGRSLLNRASTTLGREPSWEEPLPAQWRSILRRSAPLEPSAATGTRVLIAAGYGLSGSKLAFETILAAALRARGAEPVVLSCGGALPACEFNPLGCHSPDPGPYALPGGPRARRAMCDGCGAAVRAAFAPLDVPVLQLTEFARNEELDAAQALIGKVSFADYRGFEYRGVAVGEHAYSSMLRATLRGTLEPDERTAWQFRRYLLAGILYVNQLERLIEQHRPERMVAVHGVYMVHGTICDVARRHGIPVVVWGFPYRQGTVWLSHGDSYHRTLVTEPTSLWEDRALSAEESTELDAYLDSKRGGGRDYVSYHPNPEEDAGRIIEELQLDPSRPVVTLYTNVIWDAQIYYDCNVFANMFEWVYATIEHLAARPEVQLVIRIHPAEVKGGMPTRQPILPELMARFPVLPANVRIVPPESDVSSYTLAEMSAATLIYGTKMGLEIALRGVPVVVAGETFNRGKGFTHDVASAAEYHALLERIEHLPRNTPQMVERARRYAHYLYYRRMMDFPLLSIKEPHRSIGVQLAFETLDALQPGRDRTLDAICTGILEGQEFSSEPPAIPALRGPDPCSV